MNRLKTIGMTLALLAGVSHLAVSQTSKGFWRARCATRLAPYWWAPRSR